LSTQVREQLRLIHVRVSAPFRSRFPQQTNLDAGLAMRPR
jgi:hypothetical protein